MAAGRMTDHDTGNDALLGVDRNKWYPLSCPPAQPSSSRRGKVKTISAEPAAAHSTQVAIPGNSRQHLSHRRPLLSRKNPGTPTIVPDSRNDICQLFGCAPMPLHQIEGKRQSAKHIPASGNGKINDCGFDGARELLTQCREEYSRLKNVLPPFCAATGAKLGNHEFVDGKALCHRNPYRATS